VEKLIIEARVNEYALREGNAFIPYTPAEIAADAAECRQAGAAVVHFHARTPDGQPAHDFETYADCNARIRAACDALIHPTLGYVTLGAPAETRLSHIARMAADPSTRPDFAPMDMGSTNVDRFDPTTGRYVTRDLVYRNDTATLEYFAEHIARLRLKPYLVAWNIGFIRQAAVFLRAGLVAQPAYLCLCLTDGAILSGHPGTARGLQAHLDFLPADLSIAWTVCNFGGNLLALAATIIAQGGHVSIGLGDYPYTELGRPTNAELVARVAAIARDLGREVATPAEAKAMLKMH
jgi:3-keto-5-aminohexanoate cleavage enzyme